MSSGPSRFNKAEGTAWKIKTSHTAGQEEDEQILRCGLEDFWDWVTSNWLSALATSVASLYLKGLPEPAMSAADKPPIIRVPLSR